MNFLERLHQEAGAEVELGLENAQPNEGENSENDWPRMNLGIDQSKTEKLTNQCPDPECSIQTN